MSQHVRWIEFYKYYHTKSIPLFLRSSETCSFFVCTPFSVLENSFTILLLHLVCFTLLLLISAEYKVVRLDIYLCQSS